VPVAAAVVVALALAVAPAGKPRPVTARTSLQDLRLWQGAAPYLDAIATYRAGGRERAVAAVLGWRMADRHARLDAVHALTRYVDGCPGHPDDIAIRDLEAGALMLVDAALAAHEAGDRLAFADCLESGLSEFERLRALSPRPTGCADQGIATRDFMLAVSRVLLGRFEPANAGVVAERGLRAERRDPDLLLAAAAADEAQALGLSQFARDWADDIRSHRSQAQKRLREAIAVEPDLFEARLRLGRLASLTGDAASAAIELATVARRSPDPGQRYLAHLFLGADREREGRLELAAREYETSAEMVPDAQTARIALAHVRRVAGDAAGAREVVLPVLRRRWPRPRTDDPWWEYPYSRWSDGERLLEELRTRVTGP
jgi:tetratricopeptide (TPR) repeat protein